jgi:hypothetical protein
LSYATYTDFFEQGAANGKVTFGLELRTSIDDHGLKKLDTNLEQVLLAQVHPLGDLFEDRAVAEQASELRHMVQSQSSLLQFVESSC